MPSVKIKKHTPDNDMTPFVDVAFLILTFLPPFQATPASGFFHSGAEIVNS